MDKTHFSRLLANENISVVYDPGQKTASFSPTERILRLPVFDEKFPDNLYDGFIAHEIGHALYTPTDWADHLDGIPLGYVNCVEDARIEKLVKRRYPGTRNDFESLYEFLNEGDFFNETKKSMAFINRVNLYFKIGHLIDIDILNEYEQSLIDEVSICETFQEVITVSKKIYEYDKNNNEANADNTNPEQDQILSDIIEKMCEEYQSDVKSTGDVFGNMSSYKSDEVYETIKKYANVIGGKDIPEHFNEARREYSHVISSMINRFMMKRDGVYYHKTKINVTGSLDMKRLSQYKLTDDIFQTNEVKYDGEHHAAFILLDLSSSMEACFKQTVTQLLIFLEFCKSVNIPFEVYGFTTSTDNSTVYRPGIFSGESSLIYHLLSSRMQRNDYQLALSALLSNDNGLTMGGTPLIDTLFKCEILLKDFKEQNFGRKIIFCTMTDGGSTDGFMFNGKECANDVYGMKYSKQYKFSKSKYFPGIVNYIRTLLSIDCTIGFNIGLMVFVDRLNIVSYNEYMTDFITENPTIGYSNFFSINPTIFDAMSCNMLDSLSKRSTNKKISEALTNNSRMRKYQIIIGQKIIDAITKSF